MQTKPKAVPSYTPLVFGAPLQDSITYTPGWTILDSFKYYTLVYSNVASMFRIVLTTNTGSLNDADLFVGDSSVPTPNMYGANWSSATDFVEVINIPTCSTPPCNYYIGVNPFPWDGTTSYTLVAQPITTAIPLTDGVSVLSAVPTNSFEYYSITYQATTVSNKWFFQLDTLTGDPDLYLLLNAPSGTFASPTNADYVLLGGTAGTELLTILMNSPAVQTKCPVGTSCPISIMILGVVGGMFRLTASTDTTNVVVQDGVPVQGFASAGQYAFYKYQLTQANANITFAVTALSGDPDIFISTSVQNPGWLNGYNWAGTSVGDEFVVAHVGDPGYMGAGNWYYIGVNAYLASNASFILTVTAQGPGGGNKSIALMDGQPQAGVAPPHGMAYYTFQTNPTASVGIDILVAINTGDVDLYVSNLTTTDPISGLPVPLFPQVQCTRYSLFDGLCLSWGVDPTTYTWFSSEFYKSDDYLSLPPGAIAAGTNLAIGVFNSLSPGGDPPPIVPSAQFDITVSANGTNMQLQSGRQVFGYVTSPGVKYYSFGITQNNLDVIVFSQVYSGSVTLYASMTTNHPSATNNQWNSTTNAIPGFNVLGEQMLIVSAASMPQLCSLFIVWGMICRLYIAVATNPSSPPGFTSQYSILAEYGGSQSNPALLADGIPEPGYAPYRGYAYYFATVQPQPTQMIYLTVSNFVGQTDLFLNIGFNSSGFATAENGGITNADYYVPPGNAYETVIIYPRRSTPHSEPPASALGPGVTFTRSESRSGFTFDRISVPKRTGPSKATLRSLYDFSTPPPPAKVIPTDESTLSTIVNLASPEYVWTWGKRGSATLKRYGSASAAAAVRAASRLSSASLLSTHGAVEPTVDWTDLKYAPHRSNGLVPPVVDVSRASVAEAGVVGSTRESSSRAVQVVPPPHPLGPGNWCTNCPMYVSVRCATPAYSFFEVLYTADAAYIPLADHVPQQAFIPPNGTTYFAFTLSNLSADVTFVVDNEFNGVEVWIWVQSQSRPYFMPGPGNSQWQMSPFYGNTRLHLPTSTRGFCVPWDQDQSLPASSPCVFLLAISPHHREEAAQANVLAMSNQGGQTIWFLDEGLPVYDSVVEQPATGTSANYNYYTFTASAGGVPPPTVELVLNAFNGRAEMYVTNAYVLGQSPPSMLPYAGNQLVCMWASVNYTEGLRLDPRDPCYNPAAATYTIGVRGYADIGIPNFVTEYQLTANDGSSRTLAFGVALTSQLVFDNRNNNYTFTVDSVNEDVIVAVTSTHGDAGLLVSPANSAGYPYCYQAAGGARVFCYNYTWLSAGGSVSVVYINATNPCNPPYLPNSNLRPVIGFGCNPATSFLPGPYQATVYGFTAGISAYSVSVQQARQAMLLTDGQPQVGFTVPYFMCPVRNSIDGSCTGDRSTWTSAQAAFFTSRVPSIPGATLDQFFSVETLCNGNGTGPCGGQLHVYISACPTQVCSVNGICRPGCTPYNAYPWAGSSMIDTIIRDDTGAVQVPYNLCYVNASNVGSFDCIYYFGVFPICPGGPGVGCAGPDAFRVTFEGETSTERIPDDCFASGRMCQLPSETTPVAVTRRYAAYVGDTITSATVSVAACYGDVTIYACRGQAHPVEKCNPVSLPGPGNYDTTATSAGNPNSTAVFSVTMSGLFFLGLGMSGAGVSDGRFQMSIGSPNALVLTLPAGQAMTAAYTDSTQTSITISWLQPMVTSPNHLPYLPSGLMYGAYLVDPTGPCVSAQYHLNTACGVHAQFANCGSTYQYVKRSFSRGQQVTFSGLNPTTVYTAALVAICDDNCVSSTVLQGGQTIAYPPFTVPNYALSASPKPLPGPPGPNGSGGGSSSNAGAIAGGVIGALLGVALLGGVGFLAYRNWDTVKGWVPSIGGSKPPGADSYYTTKVGDGDAAASFLYEPPAAGTGDSVNDVGSAYAAM